ncbi:MAG: hypothetical protein Q9186_003806 [Xanthomendoza sp. 1 TL-2023]
MPAHISAITMLFTVAPLWWIALQIFFCLNDCVSICRCDFKSLYHLSFYFLPCMLAALMKMAGLCIAMGKKVNSGMARFLPSEDTVLRHISRFGQIFNTTLPRPILYLLGMSMQKVVAL